MGARMIALAGAPGSGKTSWAGEHFPGKSFARDWARGILTGSEARVPSPHGSVDVDGRDADALLDLIIAGRLARGLTVVVDSAGVSAQRRLALLDMVPRGGSAELVIFDVPLAVCQRRNSLRDRQVPPEVVADIWRKTQSMLTSLHPAERWDLVTAVKHDPSPGQTRMLKEARCPAPPAL